MSSDDRLFEIIRDLVMRHAPSGIEMEIDARLYECFAEVGVTLEADAAGNLVGRIPGRGGGRLAITAHKDEIGAIVTSLENEGRVRVRKLGGSHPWVYGEGIVDLLGERAVVSGVLSFGSRHVAHGMASQPPHESTLPRWTDAWIETKCSPAELADARVRPGTRMVVGRHRKAPFRLKRHIASYALDNRASLAILLELARRVKSPVPDLTLVLTAKEEMGAVGGLFHTRNNVVDALIALEIVPLAAEYPVEDTPSPVLLEADGHGLYDDALNSVLRRAAARADIALQSAVLSRFGSDASIAMRHGHVPRGACLGFPTQNTHGYEIAHLGAIENCVRTLQALSEETLTFGV
ncbi:MAG: M42 family peptidase [Gammaproteobacteria bacterium]